MAAMFCPGYTTPTVPEVSEEVVMDRGTGPDGALIARMLRLYMWLVGEVSLMVTVVPEFGVGAVWLCTQ